MDVEALALLSESKTSLEKVIKQPNNDILENIRQAGSESVNKETGECVSTITTVNKYSVGIKRAIEELKGKVQEYHMKIGQIMNQLGQEFVITDTSRSVIGIDGKDFVRERLKLIDEVQKISEQQNELLKLMNETQQVLLSVEEEGEEAISLLKNLKDNIDRYAKSIETDDRRKEREEDEAEMERKKKEEERRRQEEKRKEEEEKRRKEEEERKRKEEEERKRKEEEQRLKEEEERRKEKEKRDKMEEVKRQNPDNWPVHRYKRTDGAMDSFHRNICCMAWAMEGPNGFSKTDVTCSVQTPHGCLQRGDYLQSDVIHISFDKKETISLQVPMRILVPYKSADQSREVVMKIRKDGGEWHQVKMIKDKPKDVEKDIPFAVTEVNNFKKLDLVVVSKLKTQIIPITPEGGTFTSDVDSRTRVTAIPNTVQWPMELHMKVANVDKMAEKRRDLDNVTVISPTHELYFEKKLQKDVLLQMPVNPSKTIRELSHMKAVQSCRGTIAKEMTLDSVLDYMKESDLISSEFCSEMKNRKESAKFLDYLERCTTKEYEGLIDALRNTNQTYLARLLEDACVQNSSDYDEDISGSDFEGDITVVVMGSEEADTKLYPWKDLKKEKDTVQINLPKGRDLYRVVGLVAPKAMNDVSIRTTAEKIHDLSMQMPVELLIRQNIKDVSKVCVAWALPEQMPKCIKDVEARGFVSGPKRVINIGIGDGDNVRVTTVGNIQVAVEDQDKLSQQFFSISCPLERVFTIKEGNKKGKVSLGRYVGRIQFFVEGRGRTMMTDSVVCYLPVGDDFQRYAPILLDPEVSIVAKYVGVMLSHQPNSPETFFKDLAGKNNYRQLVHRAKRESNNGDSKDRWETFIVNWAAQRPRTENKVKGIVDLMKKHYPDLADEVMAFVHLYSGEKDGLLSTKSLEKLAQEVGRKWEDLGKVLQMDKNEVAEIKEFSQNEVQCAMRMLDHWRFSHDTVHRGMSVIEHLKSALKTAKCSSSAIQLVDRLKP